MSDLITKTAAQLADALAAGVATSVEVTLAHLVRFVALVGVVNGFLVVDGEGGDDRDVV